MKKICKKCKKEKNFVNYHLTSIKYNGKIYHYRHSKCKECRNIERMEYYYKIKKTNETIYY